MISRLGILLSRLFEKTAPDPFVIAILLTLVTAALALLIGDLDVAADESRLAALLSAWQNDNDGLWRFLAFGMQMCLILVTGHALAATKPVQRAINTLADLPGSTAQAAAMIAVIAAVTGVINWGLGLIVGALLARDVGRSLARRSIRAHYPLLCAAGYSALLVWHGGLSGSAPLTMTTRGDAENVLPAQTIERLDTWAQTNGLDQFTGVGLEQTLFSGLNAFVTIGVIVLLPILYTLLAPKRDDQLRPIDEYDVIEPPDDAPPAKATSIPEWLDRSPIVVWLLAIPLLAGLGLYVGTHGAGSIGLNQVNATMLALGLILHGSPRGYMDAVADGARGCAGIIIQFPLYGGIMGMMIAAGLITMLARGFTAIGDETTIPLLSFLAAAVTNLFVPSGGGQWGVQGPVALETGFEAGVDPAVMIMAVAYGDQLTNMLQPFWALPLLAITGVRARDIVGYTAVIMLAAGAWMAIGLVTWAIIT